MARGPHGSVVVTTVVTADGAIKSREGYVHWVTVSNSHATETASIELNDSADDGGTDRWGVVLGDVDGATATIHCVFDPPIKFTSGIFADITTGTVRMVVGYV